MTQTSEKCVTHVTCFSCTYVAILIYIFDTHWVLKTWKAFLLVKIWVCSEHFERGNGTTIMAAGAAKSTLQSTHAYFSHPFFLCFQAY